MLKEILEKDCHNLKICHFSAFAKTLEATSFSPQSTKKHRPDSSPSLANKLASKKAQETIEVSSKDVKSSKTPSKRSRSKTPTKSPTAKRSKSKTPEKSSKTPKSSSKTPTQNKKSLDESVSELPGTPQVSFIHSFIQSKLLVISI